MGIYEKEEKKMEYIKNSIANKEFKYNDLRKKVTIWLWE